MANCIQPAQMGGGQAFSISSSTGYGGSPSSTTIRYFNSSGSFSSPNIGISSPMSVGAGGKTRQMVPVKYSIDQSVGGSTLTVTFQDYRILKLQRQFIVLNDPDINVPGGGCVKALGEIYHKPPGAPNKTDTSTLTRGPAKKIKIGKMEKKLGTEYVFYSGSQLSGVVGSFIGGALRGLISGFSMLNKTGNALSIIQSLAGESGVELYADDNGKLDVLSSGNSDINVGGGCEIVSLKTTSDFTCTTDEGGYAIYKHEDVYKKERDQPFMLLDVLGLPIPDCNKEMQLLYKKNMTKKQAEDLEKAMKMGWLNESWQNWQGLEPYLYMKRGASASCTDSIDVFYVTNQTDQAGGHGSNTHASSRKLPRKCIKVGAVPTKTTSETPNETIDMLFSCLTPCVLDVENVDASIRSEILFSYKEANADNKNPKILEALDSGKLEIMVTHGKAKFECNQGELSNSGYSPFPKDDPIAFVEGSKASMFNVLSELAQTIGKYWIMSGGGGGGGAGLITQADHQAREYQLEGNESTYWYHPDLSVTDTVFASIYESLFANLSKNLNEGNGAKNSNLSISQFLQLAAEIKNLGVNGNGEQREALGENLKKALNGGKGKPADQIQAETEANAKNCNKQPPKGIVILDKSFRGLAMPEQDENLQLISGGVEVHSDVGASDVVRFLVKQVELVSFINPCDNKADCIDKSLDSYRPHDDWQIDAGGKGKQKPVTYKEDNPREYFSSKAQYPSCDAAYNVSVNYADISGTVLWRDTDCFGNILPWEEDFREAGKVGAALQKAVSGMRKSDTEKCKSTTVSTCGSKVANMPGGGKTQDYSVEYAEDGSVVTNFTVSGSEAKLANKSIRPGNHNFNTPIGNQPKSGNPVGQGPSGIASNSPSRSARNPLTG
jgi:hypothetical protein